MEIDKRIGVCILAAVALVGLIVGMLIMIASPATRSQLICPPFMDKERQEIKGIDIWYELGQGPEFTELDLEFAKACGFEGITGPRTIEPPEPPPPEEGGA